MRKWIVAVIIVVAVVGLSVLGLVKFGIGVYNGLVQKGQGVDKSWGQVENVLQRRNDLIPNLVNVVQAYAIHEQEVFIKVAEARALWTKATQGGTISDKIKADGAMSGALLNLMAVVERYPELKANENFLALQDELAGTENRIAVERNRYNESVMVYNTYAKTFPNSLIVGFTKMPGERDYFKAEEGAAKAPEVKIGYPGVPVPGVTQPAPMPAQPTTPPTEPKVLAAPAITPPPPPAAVPTPPALPAAK